MKQFCYPTVYHKFIISCFHPCQFIYNWRKEAGGFDDFLPFIFSFKLMLRGTRGEKRPT